MLESLQKPRTDPCIPGRLFFLINAKIWTTPGHDVSFFLLGFCDRGSVTGPPEGSSRLSRLGVPRLHGTGCRGPPWHTSSRTHTHGHPGLLGSSSHVWLAAGTLCGRIHGTGGGHPRVRSCRSSREAHRHGLLLLLLL